MKYFRLCLQKKFKAVLWVKILCLHLFVNAAYAQSSNSDYLNSLEGEASGLELDGQTKNLQKKSFAAKEKLFNGVAQGKKGGAIAELLPGLTIEQLGIVLKNNYMGSYLFFKRLSDSGQEEVYQFYKNNPDPQKVREKILQVNKK